LTLVTKPTGAKIPETQYLGKALILLTLNSKFTGFSFCHPNYCDYLLHSFVRHALQSANSTQEATATFLLLPDWLGWSKNGYMIWINEYPEHALVLAKFSADSMLLNPTEVGLDAPPQS
jgi:hypothetical protein